MAKEEVEEKEAGAEVKPKKEKSNLVPLLIIIIVVIVAQLGIAFAVVKITAPKEEADTTAQVDSTVDTTGSTSAPTSPANEQIYATAFDMIVTIAGTNAERYLKVQIQIAYDGDMDEKILESLVGKLPTLEIQIRNHINEYLSSLTFEEASDKNAQQNIRGDLLRGINSFFPAGGGSISNVYITQYIIQ